MKTKKKIKNIPKYAGGTGSLKLDPGSLGNYSVKNPTTYLDSIKYGTKLDLFDSLSRATNSLSLSEATGNSALSNSSNNLFKGVKYGGLALSGYDAINGWINGGDKFQTSLDTANFGAQALNTAGINVGSALPALGIASGLYGLGKTAVNSVETGLLDPVGGAITGGLAGWTLGPVGAIVGATAGAIAGSIGTPGSVDYYGNIQDANGLNGLFGFGHSKGYLNMLARRAKTNQAHINASQRLRQLDDYSGVTLAADGGTIPTTLAYLDDGELIRTPDGTISEIPEEGKPVDSNLVNVPEGTQVLSDKLKVPGTNKTYAEVGKEIMKPKKYGKDIYALNSLKLNDMNNQIAYDALLAKQESRKNKYIKSKNGIPTAVKGSDGVGTKRTASNYDLKIVHPDGDVDYYMTGDIYVDNKLNSYRVTGKDSYAPINDDGEIVGDTIYIGDATSAGGNALSNNLPHPDNHPYTSRSNYAIMPTPMSSNALRRNLAAVHGDYVPDLYTPNVSIANAADYFKTPTKSAVRNTRSTRMYSVPKEVTETTPIITPEVPVYNLPKGSVKDSEYYSKVLDAWATKQPRIGYVSEEPIGLEHLMESAALPNKINIPEQKVDLAKIKNIKSRFNSDNKPNLFSTNFDLGDLVNLAGSIKSGVRPEPVGVYTYEPTYGPTTYDINPIIDEINTSDAMSRYNASRVSPTTGASMTQNLAASAIRNRAMSDAYSRKYNVETQLAQRNAAIANARNRFDAEARHRQAVEYAQNKGMADTVNTRRKDVLATNIAKYFRDKKLGKRDAAILKYMEPFLSDTSTASSIEQIMNLLK